MSDERIRRRWVGRAVIASVIPVGLVSATAHPALADPILDAAPDAGAYPIPSQVMSFPEPAPQSAAPASSAVGPLAAEIIAAADAAQRLGEQVKALEDELAAAHEKTASATSAWEHAAAVLEATRPQPQTSPPASSSASPSTSASGAPTVSGTPSATTVAPATSAPAPDASGTATPTPTATTSAGLDASGQLLSDRAAALREERAARTTLDTAQAAEQEVAGRHTVVRDQFQRHQTALQTLTSRNANQLTEAQRARDEYELSLAAARGASTAIDGKQAAPEALAAVAFALAQRGKPYEWAAEGPYSYDCSGLMLAAYLSVGVRLPRVANNQYGAGQPVLASQLLPGDMIFFSTNPYDWRQIHHVAMYIGNGQVVQAPTFGDVVKVSPIWWSEYFGATRIFPAVPIPGANPEPTPDPTTPAPTTPAPPTPDPTTPDPTTPDPTTPGPTTPPPTGTPTATPTTAAPTGTGSASPTVAGTSSTATASTTSTPTPQPSPLPTPDPAVTTSATTAQRAPRRFFRR